MEVSDDHIKKLDEVLQRLAIAGFRLNVRKSFFAIDKVDYLGYHLTRRGLFPQPKKVEAIQKLTPPTMKRQLRRFLGMVNYYRKIKRLITKETMLWFPDFNKEFHIYTNASDYQLGAVIMQDNRPLAFYSRKFNSAQKRYTTGEQELLSIVETLTEFRSIL